MSNRTLVLLKPDAVERQLVGGILSRFETKGLKIVALELRTLDAAILERHYEEHKGKGFYAELVAFMSRGPVVALVVEGPEDTWEIVRSMMGATNPRAAAPGTIRGDYGTLFTENLVHGSDSAASAAREIGIFFPQL
jgi:nucleoside-diphosphate kinase